MRVPVLQEEERNQAEDGCHGEEEVNPRVCHEEGLGGVGGVDGGCHGGGERQLEGDYAEDFLDEAEAEGVVQRGDAGIEAGFDICRDESEW